MSKIKITTTTTLGELLKLFKTKFDSVQSEIDTPTQDVNSLKTKVITTDDIVSGTENSATTFWSSETIAQKLTELDDKITSITVDGKEI